MAAARQPELERWLARAAFKAYFGFRPDEHNATPSLPLHDRHCLPAKEDRAP